MENKEKLAELLEQTAVLMKIADENPFKIRAFENGAQALLKSELSLEEMATGKTKVPGIGAGLLQAIKEYIDTGTIEAYVLLSKKVPAAVLELMKVPGLGAKKAQVLHEELGIQNLGELAYACRENRLSTLKGFGQATQEKILKSLEEMQSFEGKVRLDEALERYEVLEQKIRKHLGPSVRLEPLGELARHCEIVQLLEILVISKKKDWEKAFSKKELSDASTWEHGTDSFSVTTITLEKAALPLRVYHSEKDISPATKTLLLAAGEIRGKIEANPKLVQSWPASWLEAEWVHAGRQPAATAYQQKKCGSVKGIFHCHTNQSDGRNTLEEMITEAQALGYEYIGISDHSQSAYYAQGLKPNTVREQRKHIAALQKKFSIRIFHGIESDILIDGALDYEKDVLQEFDFVVGSIHSRFQMAKPEMTARIVRALKHPAITMLGHPSGRLLLARKPFDADWEECFDAAKESGAAIEINANPQRLDLDWRHGKAIETRGLNVCINPDAHSTQGLQDTKFGEWMAEKAMIPEALILNLRSVSQMEAFLSQRKKQAWR